MKRFIVVLMLCSLVCGCKGMVSAAAIKPSVDVAVENAIANLEREKAAAARANNAQDIEAINEEIAEMRDLKQTVDLAAGFPVGTAGASSGGER